LSSVIDHCSLIIVHLSVAFGSVVIIECAPERVVESTMRGPSLSCSICPKPMFSRADRKYLTKS